MSHWVAGISIPRETSWRQIVWMVWALLIFVIAMTTTTWKVTPTLMSTTTRKHSVKRKMQTSERRRMEKLILRRYDRERVERSSTVSTGSDHVNHLKRIIPVNKVKGPTSRRMMVQMIWHAIPWFHVENVVTLQGR
jgi:hypothetical protein